MNPSIYYGLVKKLSGNHPHILETAAARIVDRISPDYTYQSPHLYHQNRIVIPLFKRDKILSLAHNHPLTGHLGITNTYTRIRQSYFWPGMYEDIKNYVQTCPICQKRAKDRQNIPITSSRIIPIPFHHIGIDVIGPLPITPSGNRYVVLSIDFFSKYPEGKALKKADATTITQFLYEDIVCRHGVPVELTSDRGTEFCNELVTALTQTFHIKHIRTTAYHPQGNGQVERTNRTLKNILSKLVTEYSQPWDYYLHSALFALRTIRQESTKVSPFEILQGLNPKTPLSIEENRIQEENDDLSWENLVWAHIQTEVTKLEQTREKAHKYILQAQERQRNNANQKMKSSQEALHIGDKVLLYRDMVEASWSAKLESKWNGPFIVAKVKGTSIWLRKLDGSLLPNAVHLFRLKKYHGI